MTIKELWFDMNEYHSRRKRVKMHKKAHKLMNEFEAEGYLGYACETEDGRMRLEFSKKRK